VNGVIQIDFRDSRPIYEQIKDGMLRLIMTQALKPNDRIPSVRELAAQLAINPNTIQRAYRELEREGYIYKVTGRGSFVAEIDLSESPRKKELMTVFDKTVKELLYLQTTVNELTARIKTLSEGGEPL
jgi:GntR family transcriptional regulator